jgi:hypothetical protein
VVGGTMSRNEALSEQDDREGVVSGSGSSRGGVAVGVAMQLAPIGGQGRNPSCHSLVQVERECYGRRQGIGLSIGCDILAIISLIFGGLRLWEGLEAPGNTSRCAYCFVVQS